MKIVDPGAVPASESHLTVNVAENCVMARIVRQGERHQANFTLKKLGTWKRAMKEGRKWVKATIVALPPKATMAGRMTSRNSSGFVGVRLVRGRKVRNGKEYLEWRWLAFWPGCPFAGGIGFSISRYGDKGAFMRAYLARDFQMVDREWLEAVTPDFMKSPEGALALRRKAQSPVL
jgi:hypothetical protein